MLSENRLILISKYLSYHLRHHPEKLGLKLASGGWVPVRELLAACQQKSFTLDLHELQEVVARNDKKRFSFDSTGTLIRANQGHSVNVDLQLQEQTPPEVLYHGTGKQFISSILNQGLCKMSRHYVHLSADKETARKVGTRHGKPAIFAVASAIMHNNGYTFYCSDNNVWLVDHVPPEYLQLIDRKTPLINCKG